MAADLETTPATGTVPARRPHRLVLRRHRPRFLTLRHPSGPRGAPRRTSQGVRRRRERDLHACARLLRSVFYEGQYPVVWPADPCAWLAAEDVLDAWVVERQGQLLGHVAIGRVGTDPVSALRWREATGRDPRELACVTRMFVRGKARGRGIGSALLATAEAEIRRRGLLPVVEVVSTSADALRLYEERGWHSFGVHPWAGPSDKLRVHHLAAPER